MELWLIGRTTAWKRIRGMIYIFTHPQHWFKVNDQLHNQTACPWESANSSRWLGGRLGPRASTDLMAKRKIPAPTRNLTPDIQPIISQYSYWNITTHQYHDELGKQLELHNEHNMSLNLIMCLQNPQWQHFFALPYYSNNDTYMHLISGWKNCANVDYFAEISEIPETESNLTLKHHEILKLCLFPQV